MKHDLVCLLHVFLITFKYLETKLPERFNEENKYKTIIKTILEEEHKTVQDLNSRFEDLIEENKSFYQDKLIIF